MNTHDTDPVHVSLTVGPRGEDTRARIVVNGVDLTKHCRGFSVYAGVGAVTGVWLDLIGVTLDVEADVPRSRIQERTLDEEEAREQARQERDPERGARTYGKKGPSVQLAISLGQVKA